MPANGTQHCSPNPYSQFPPDSIFSTCKLKNETGRSKNFLRFSRSELVFCFGSFALAVSKTPYLPARQTGPIQ
jgi:hypothetical protein